MRTPVSIIWTVAVLFSMGLFTQGAIAATPAPAPPATSASRVSAISADDAVIAAAATATPTATPTPTPTATPTPTTTVKATPAPATTLAPIASATPGSSTFQLVNKSICSDKIVGKLNKIYAKNHALFEECTTDADFQIFPNSGKRPTAEQVRAMATSRSCFAIFSGVVRAEFPACDVGGLALKSVTETLLKIKVDVDEGRESASGQRFNELIKWRRNVNLAREAGVPYDGDSELYLEFKVNLWKARASTTVRVSSDFTLEYQLPDGTYTHGQITFSALDDDDSGSGASGVVGRVRPAGSSSGSLAAGYATPTVSSGVGAHASAFARVITSLLVLTLNPLLL